MASRVRRTSRYAAHRQFWIANRDRRRLAFHIDEEKRFPTFLQYPKVRQAFTSMVQVGRALAECLNRRIRFQAHPLSEHIFAKTLQSPTELRAIHLNDAFTTRPGV